MLLERKRPLAIGGPSRSELIECPLELVHHVKRVLGGQSRADFLKRATSAARREIVVHGKFHNRRSADSRGTAVIAVERRPLTFDLGRANGDSREHPEENGNDGSLPDL